MNNIPMNGNFTPMTTNMQMHGNQNRFNQAFMPSNNMIPRIDYENKGNLVHNNMGRDILRESIVEYRVHIDSADRDPKYFKNPFKYTVSFGVPADSIRREYDKEGNETEYTMRSEPRPRINRAFKNVKYVKIENIVLPRHTIMYPDGETYKLDTDIESESNIYDDRYVILNIKELMNDEIYGTNEVTNDSFGIIFPDKLISRHFYFGTPLFSSRYFQSSSLANINKLTIEFLDSYGNPLKYKMSDEVNGTITSEDALIDADQEGNFSVETTDVRHPLNKQLQNHITLTIGVLEPRQNVDTKYYA